MINTTRLQARIAPILVVIFSVCILASAFLLYSLPDDAIRAAGSGDLLSRTYFFVGFAFLTGFLAIYAAMATRKELVVYRERTHSNVNDTGEGNSQSGTTGISAAPLHEIKASEKAALYQQFLQTVCDQLEAGQGAYYEAIEDNGTRKVVLRSGYALAVSEGADQTYDFGEGLIGQAAAERKTLLVDEVPEGYIRIISGLGSASPRYLLIVPVVANKVTIGVFEIASFHAFAEHQRTYLEEAANILAARKEANQHA